MAQPSFLATGTTPLQGDSEWIHWTRILGEFQNRPGANPRNNPARTDTLRRIKEKIALSVASGSTGGGGGGGGGSGDPDVDAFLLCSGISDPTIVAALLGLVTDLKNNSLWTSFDAIYPFVGGAATPHSCNLRDTSKYGITWHGGVTHDSNGITGNGSTGYGDSGFNPTSAAGNFVLNSGSMGIYCRTASPSDGSFMGAWQGVSSNTNTRLFSVAAGPLFNILGFSADNNFTVSSSDFHGSLIASRTASNVMGGYSTSSSGSNSAYSSNTLVNLNFYLLGSNLSLTASNFTNANLAFAFVGGGFTSGQITIIKNSILTFQTVLGRA